MPLLIELSPGELIDRLSILTIKSERIVHPAKRAHVLLELQQLQDLARTKLPATLELRSLAADLRIVNETLWDVEDALRRHELRQDFGQEFVELARSVYRHNDRRAALKRQINDLLGSSLFEEKSYAA